MLARLPLQDGLDWPVSRYGSAKNILDTHHGTITCCWWRVALPCQGLSSLQPAMPSQLGSEKHTLPAWDAEACLAREGLFCSRFRPLHLAWAHVPAAHRYYAGLPLLTSSQSPHRGALFVRNALRCPPSHL
jgi:hypothetical protein